MKKILIFLLCIIPTTILFSQTKNETKEWIIEKHNQNKRQVNQQNEIKFEGNNLIYLKYFYGYQYEKIEIKNIDAISIKKVKYPQIDEECYVIVLKGVREEYGSIENGEYQKMGEYGNEKSDITILLDLDFGKDDLPKRMEKALLRLVTLYGGKAKILKEAF